MNPLERARILIVEDATDIRDVFSLLLRAEGANVTATGSGREAVEITTARNFDVLLTDLGLPDVPGHVLIRHVTADALRRPWIVVLTGYGEPFLAQARQAGADVVLTKPVTWQVLVHQLVPRPALGGPSPSDRC